MEQKWIFLFAPNAVKRRLFYGKYLGVSVRGGAP